jgi:dimethylglycine catabolism A
MLDPLVDAIDVTSSKLRHCDDAAADGGPPGSLLGYAKAVKKRVNVPVIGVGRLTWLLEDLHQAVEEGQLDLVALGRSQLADPDTPAKTRRGQPDRVRRCLAVNECVSLDVQRAAHPVRHQPCAGPGEARDRRAP